MTASAASGMGAPLGLVSCSTTQTRATNANNSTEPRSIDQRQSRKARTSRAVMKSASLHFDRQAAYYPRSRRVQSIMATLTYRKDAQPDASDVRGLLTCARMWFTRKHRHLPKDVRPKLRYVWVAELTKKGKLHYHVLFFLPPGMKLPMFDVRGWWKKGATRLEWARHAVQYMAKYASKGGERPGQKLPKGFRIHGCGGLEQHERAERRYHLAPGWVRDFFEPDEQPKPTKGGGWFSPVSGYFQESPYFLISASPGRVVIGIKHWRREQLRALNQ